MTGAKTAIRISDPRITIPAMAERLRSRFRNATCHRPGDAAGKVPFSFKLTVVASKVAMCQPLSDQTNPGVQISVHNIYDQIDENKPGGGNHGKPLDDRIIAGRDAIHNCPTNPAQAK